MESTAQAKSERSAELDDLMSRYQQAELVSAAALVRRASPLLYRFLGADGASKPDIEDMLQETWMQIHRARHTWRPTEPVLPWLYAIARHVKVDGYRKRQRRLSREQPMQTLPDFPTPPPRSPAQWGEFDTLVASLPPGQREVITMLKVTGMSIEEVARATASTAGAVKLKAHRAYERLRRLLGTQNSGRR